MGIQLRKALRTPRKTVDTTGFSTKAGAMPEPFKNMFNPRMIAMMGQHLKSASGDFDASRFESLACQGLEKLELMDRSRQIAEALGETLPKDFRQAAKTLVSALHPETEAPISQMIMDEKGIRGWPIMPMGQYVAKSGQEHAELALETLCELTKRFSAEFAIRPFLDKRPELIAEQVMGWLKDPNEHVRRLASEGTRPYLPWGINLPALVNDPAPILPILAGLRDDPSEYVRRSVANSLNDISKDHPALVAKIASDWLKDATPERERLIRHAGRTLVKKGHPAMLSALGYKAPKILDASLTIAPREIHEGDSVSMELRMRSAAKSTQPVIIDYVIERPLASGRHGIKVFKWTETRLRPEEDKLLKKSHPIRRVTTRTNHPGVYKVWIQVNGQKLCGDDFALKAG